MPDCCGSVQFSHSSFTWYTLTMQPYALDQEIRGDAEKDTEFINMVQHLAVTEPTLTVIHRVMDSDPVMSDLKTTIRAGWSDTLNQVPVKVKTTSRAETN